MLGVVFYGLQAEFELGWVYLDLLRNSEKFLFFFLSDEYNMVKVVIVVERLAVGRTRCNQLGVGVVVVARPQLWGIAPRYVCEQLGKSVVK